MSDNNESRFNQGAGKQRNPLKKLADKEIPNVENNMKEPLRETKDILQPNEIPTKKGVEVNPSMKTPTKYGQEGIEPMKGTPFKTTAQLNNLKRLISSGVEGNFNSNAAISLTPGQSLPGVRNILED